MSIKRSAGRPPAKFTPEQRAMAEGMVLVGVPFSEIAQRMGVAENTLKKHLGDTLRDAKAKCTAAVAQNLFRMATGTGKEGVTAAIFYLKTQAGWKETSAVEVGGLNGGPIQVDLSKLSDEQLTALTGIVAAASVADPGGAETPGA